MPQGRRDRARLPRPAPPAPAVVTGLHAVGDANGQRHVAHLCSRFGDHHRELRSVAVDEREHRLVAYGIALDPDPLLPRPRVGSPDEQRGSRGACPASGGLCRGTRFRCGLLTRPPHCARRRPHERWSRQQRATREPPNRGRREKRSWPADGWFPVRFRPPDRYRRGSWSIGRGAEGNGRARVCPGSLPARAMPPSHPHA
jgi:hypothetical protein